jgi:hypothetical protein
MLETCRCLWFLIGWVGIEYWCAMVHGQQNIQFDKNIVVRQQDVPLCSEHSVMTVFFFRKWYFLCYSYLQQSGVKGKQSHYRPWQAGPEGSRRLRLPDFKTIGTWRCQDCQPYAPAAFTPPGNIPGTHFCYRLSQPQGHSATGKMMSMKNCNDTIGNQTRDLPVHSTVPQPTVPPCALLKTRTGP